MAVHDTIGDFLTVIRNAGSAGRPSCLYPHSKLRSGIASILKSRGFVEKFDELESDKGLKQIEIHLKYVNGEHAIRGIARTSKPGRRSYCGYRDIPNVLGGLGISILSTPQGIMDDRDARKNKLGGEVLCSVW
ncbi:MAG: 30S ribosomal protein S8 [Verrucomicrobiota bacterium]|jgi:small subunit ribosomal protein S8|nr:30S ribosomal protein S8 [Verrucomicrobiota bacterium]|tara:strand:- start:313 stop:711 length:399 start_codon:yes stop_codon:yes gene_type:complete